MKLFGRLRRRFSDRVFAQAFRRRLMQIAAFGFINSDPANLLKGTINKGEWKKFCIPGMNCYSCPAARFSCPIGALQAVNGSMDFKFSFYAVGFLLAVGALLGRWVCAWLCPFGLIQELIHRIPSRKLHLPRLFTWVKYLLLIVFVFLLPVAVTDFVGSGEPAFCQYLCPVGTLEGGIPLLLGNPALRSLIGPLFWWKAALLLLTLTGCVFIRRFFCKLACPLGAFLGVLNRVSAYHLEIDPERCVHCGACAQACPMDVDPCRKPSSPECIRCGRCRAVCPQQAIRFRFGWGPEHKKGELVSPPQKPN